MQSNNEVGSVSSVDARHTKVEEMATTPAPVNVVAERPRESAEQRKHNNVNFSRRGKMKQPVIETRKQVDISTMLKQVLSQDAYTAGFTKEQYKILAKVFEEGGEFAMLEDQYSDDHVRATMEPLVKQFQKRKRGSNIFKYIRARYANLRKDDQHSKKVTSLTKSLNHCRRAVAKNILAKKKKQHFEPKTLDYGFEYQGCPQVFSKVLSKVSDWLDPLKRFVRELYRRITEMVSLIISFAKRATKAMWNVVHTAFNEFVTWAKARLFAYGIKRVFEVLLDTAGVAKEWIVALMSVITEDPVTALILAIITQVKVCASFRKKKLWTWWLVPWLMILLANPFVNVLMLLQAVLSWGADETASKYVIVDIYAPDEVTKQDATFDWFDRISASKEAVKSLYTLIEDFTKMGSKILIIDRLFDVVTKMVHLIHWCLTGVEWEDRHFIGWYNKVNTFVDEANTTIFGFEKQQNEKDAMRVLELMTEAAQLEKDVLLRKVPTKRLVGFDECKRKLQQLSPLARKYLLTSQPIVKPVGILIKGLPGAGKDTFVDFFCRETNMDKVIFPFSEDYFEAYQGQQVIVAQEAFAKATVEDVTDHIDKILHMLENTPQPVAKAFGDKGSICYTSKYVFVTTNKITPLDPGEHSMQDIGAFYRRFELIATFEGTKKDAKTFTKDYTIHIEKFIEKDGYGHYERIATVGYSRFINLILAARTLNERKFGTNRAMPNQHVFVDETSFFDQKPDPSPQDSQPVSSKGYFTYSTAKLTEEEVHQLFEEEDSWARLSALIAKQVAKPVNLEYDFNLYHAMKDAGFTAIDRYLATRPGIEFSEFVRMGPDSFYKLHEEMSLAEICEWAGCQHFAAACDGYVLPETIEQPLTLEELVVVSTVSRQVGFNFVTIRYKLHMIYNTDRRDYYSNPFTAVLMKEYRLTEFTLMELLRQAVQEADQSDLSTAGQSVTDCMRSKLVDLIYEHEGLNEKGPHPAWKAGIMRKLLLDDFIVPTITGEYNPDLFTKISNAYRSRVEQYTLDEFIYFVNCCNPDVAFWAALFENLPKIFAGAVVVSAFYMIYRFFTSKEEKPLTREEYEQQSEDWAIKKKSVEKKDSKLMKPKEVSMQGVTVSMAAKIQSQLVTFEARTIDTARTVQGICVTNRCVLFPYHVLGVDPKAIVEIHLNRHDWGTGIVVKNPKIVEFENDCALLQVPKDIQGISSILSYFVSAEINVTPNMPMVYLGPSQRDLPILAPVTEYRPVEFNSREGHSETSNRFARVRCITRTLNGDCGSPYILAGNNGNIDTKIYGIHTGVVNADPSVKIVSLITKEEILSGLEHFVPDEVEKQSLVVKLENAGFVITGQIPHHYYPPRKCKIVPTPVANCFIQTAMAPAMLVPTGGISPLGNAIQDWARKTIMPVSEQRKEELTQYLVASIPDPRRPPLSAIEAVAGTMDGSIKPMDLNTSAGYGYPNKKKRDVIKVTGPLNLPIVDPELERQLEQLIYTLQEGGEPELYSVVSLKPELRKKAKVETGQTRAFCVGSLASVILGKMLFDPVIIEYVSDPINSKSSVGINVHGNDAGRFMQRFKYRDHNMPLDSRRNDKSVNPDHGSAIREAHARKLCMAYSAVKHLTLFTKTVAIYDMKSLVYNFLKHETTGPIVFINVLAKPEYHIPSGFYLTAMLNKDHNEVLIADYCIEAGLVQSLLEYKGRDPYGVYMVNTMKDLMEESYHGDDMFNQLKKPEYADRLNCVSIAKFATYRGLTITTAVKSGEVVPFVSLDEATYLKRTFVLVNGVWRAPRKIEEILEAFNWWEPGDQSWPAYLDTVIDAVLIEIHHHGRDTFNFWRDKFIELYHSQTGRLKVAATYDYISHANGLV